MFLELDGSQELTSSHCTCFLNNPIDFGNDRPKIVDFRYTERKTDPKSRYFSMFESTFKKCLIQLSVELIQLDIVYDSLNYKE